MHMCAHTNIFLELPFPLELKTQWNLLTIYSTNACEAGGIGTAVPFHNKIKSFHSSEAAKNINLSAVFKPETNWMNPRPLMGAICLTWSKISQIQLIQEHPNTHTQSSFLSTAETWYGLPSEHIKLMIVLYIRLFC